MSDHALTSVYASLLRSVALCSLVFVTVAFTMFVEYIFFACFASVCAKLGLDPFVSGGFRADKRTSPWHAGLYTKTTVPYMNICGGTLISKSVVVSAAHCFSRDRQRPSASNYAVAVGKIYRPWNNTHDTSAQKSDVKEIRIPPRYQGSAANFQDDISLIIVTTEFQYNEYVRPACFSFDDDFDEQQLRAGNKGKVVGWGLTGENTPPSQVLQAAILPCVAIDKCIDESPSSFRSSITGDKICAGYNNGTAVCRGDSGGGLVFSTMIDGTERFFLRGIVSTSPTSEGQCNIYTWATFTHLLRHERFVKSVVPEPDDTCLTKTSDSDGVGSDGVESDAVGAGGVEDRFSEIIKIPKLQRCKCTCPPGTYKTRHGKYCKRL